MRFDSATQTLKCLYCGLEEDIANAGHVPMEHAFDPSEPDDHLVGNTDWGLRQFTLHCDNCSGEFIVPEAVTAGICPFCASAKVINRQNAGSVRPETIIPFKLSMEQALTAFRDWKKKRWFVPNAFKNGHVDSALRGVYIPYWTFDADTASSYTAQRGDYHYRTETRTRTVDGKQETYTVQVRYTVWTSVSGSYAKWYNDVLIPASNRYDDKLLNELSDFNLSQLREYQPEYLSGYVAERYTVGRNAGWRQARSRIDSWIKSSVKSQIGGDEVSQLNIDSRYFSLTYKHLLLPVWSAAYSYRSKPYQYMVNAQTSLVSGTVPRSPWKITLFALMCVMLVAAAVYGAYYYDLF